MNEIRRVSIESTIAEEKRSSLHSKYDAASKEHKVFVDERRITRCGAFGVIALSIVSLDRIPPFDVARANRVAWIRDNTVYCRSKGMNSFVATCERFVISSGFKCGCARPPQMGPHESQLFRSIAIPLSLSSA